nr:spidroin-1-like [Aegilops tauschii subsp. strangulata]
MHVWDKEILKAPQKRLKELKAELEMLSANGAGGLTGAGAGPTGRAAAARARAEAPGACPAWPAREQGQAEAGTGARARGPAGVNGGEPGGREAGHGRAGDERLWREARRDDSPGGRGAEQQSGAVQRGAPSSAAASRSSGDGDSHGGHRGGARGVAPSGVRGCGTASSGRAGPGGERGGVVQQGRQEEERGACSQRGVGTGQWGSGWSTGTTRRSRRQASGEWPSANGAGGLTVAGAGPTGRWPWPAAAARARAEAPGACPAWPVREQGQAEAGTGARARGPAGVNGGEPGGGEAGHGRAGDERLWREARRGDGAGGKGAEQRSGAAQRRAPSSAAASRSSGDRDSRSGDRGEARGVAPSGVRGCGTASSGRVGPGGERGSAVQQGRQEEERGACSQRGVGTGQWGSGWSTGTTRRSGRQASGEESDHSGGCGAVVRDNRGGFIAATTANLLHVTDVVSAEAAALREGLKLLQNLGCSNVMVRMDNIVVVDCLRLNEGHAMVAAPIFEECRILLRDKGKVTIEHCNRESNCVAHELASWGGANTPSLWVDAPPDFIVKFLADDVNLIDQ